MSKKRTAKKVKEVRKDAEEITKTVGGDHGSVSIYLGIKLGLKNPDFSSIDFGSTLTRKNEPGETVEEALDTTLEGVELWFDKVHADVLIALHEKAKTARNRSAP